MGVTYNNRIVTDGLVLCLDAASKRSYPGTGTTWTDLKGGNNGTLANMDTSNFDESNGGSLVFDGTDEYIYGGDTTGSITNQCSVSIWYKATGIPSNNDTAGGAIFGQSNNYHHGLIVLHAWAYERVLMGTRINDSTNTSNNSVGNNEYHYITAQQDGSQQQIFIDGELLTYRSYSLTPYAVNPAYQIGRWGYSSYGRHFNGHIYSVSLYNRALSADEIRQNYLSTKERYA